MLTWNFETCFLVFLAITFVSQAVATRLKSMLPMPLLLGALCAAGFYTGLFPKDMMITANMIAVGTIAFNVLVIHSGTMIDVALIRNNKREALVAILPAILIIPITLLVLTPLFGRDIALLAPGAAVGGGAACAIASRWVMEKNPAISVFPWMLFMFQGLFCIPVLRYALKKESTQLLLKLRSGEIKPQNAPTKPAAAKNETTPVSLKPVDKIPAAYKTTAYYLGTVMVVSVLNKFLLSLLPGAVTLNLNITALLLGFVFGRIGLLDKGPLNSSDSYGLLLLGLMGLFANTIANNTLQNLLRLLPAVLVTLLVSTVVLVGGAAILARVWKLSVWRCIILAVNSMMGFPVNKALISEASSRGETPEEKGYLASRFGPALGMGTMLVSNALSILVASVLVNII
ncbi:hypothetical protein LJC42_00530 [Eubacteriales bacterium OttesenSCG-928-K08]|nr:hypothetical protein [Eubacteriales bacterium OttesenSCG-928-K08]